jgi:hypothetical protein
VLVKPLLTQSDAAAYLHQSERTLERWRISGSGPVFVKLGKKVFYTEGALEAHVEKCKRTSTSDQSAA